MQHTLPPQLGAGTSQLSSHYYYFPFLSFDCFSTHKLLGVVEEYLAANLGFKQDLDCPGELNFKKHDLPKRDIFVPSSTHKVLWKRKSCTRIYRPPQRTIRGPQCVENYKTTTHPEWLSASFRGISPSKCWKTTLEYAISMAQKLKKLVRLQKQPGVWAWESPQTPLQTPPHSRRRGDLGHYTREVENQWVFSIPGWLDQLGCVSNLSLSSDLSPPLLELCLGIKILRRGCIYTKLEGSEYNRWWSMAKKIAPLT